ncbi:MAG TPA: DUF3592 domain-containing protein [Fontimonas sp.]
MTATLSILILLTGIAGGAWLWLRRDTRLQRLERSGQPTTGRLREKRMRSLKGRTIYSLVYEYSAGTVMHQRSIEVSQSAFDAAEEGTSIDMVYLPADPRVAASRERIGQAISAARARDTGMRRRWDD